MKPWGRYLICGILGIALGAGAALRTVKAGALGKEMIGPWATGTDFGTAAASARTRAIVSLRGLLALPAHEARYYNAATDDAGQPLESRCTYRLSGGALPAKWWSITLYDPAGYLVGNPAGIYSVGSLRLAPEEAGKWAITVSPDRNDGHWLPAGGQGRFELTLRAYLPSDGGTGNFTRSQLPSIVKEACK